MEKKNITVGILAHVDAGKTTLSEAMLYLTGRIKQLGRVDHGSTHLDTDSIERERGITIFSKQAVLDYGNTTVYLLDTPGHVDFSAETERTMQVLDYAVLVISGLDGVQAHTQTLWRLLRRYRVPGFIFVTKMDLSHYTRQQLMAELRHSLFEGCVDFTSQPDGEEIAMLDEELLDKYLSGEELTGDDIATAVAMGKLCPCFFGSGLKLQGVEALLQGLDSYTLQRHGGSQFGAKVYKIMRDKQNSRLSCMKLTSGTLSVRDSLRYVGADGETYEEKINQIRIYSGAKFETVDKVSAGEVCAVTGLGATLPGQGLGIEADSSIPVLQPFMTYRLGLEKGVDPMTVLPKLRLLEEEDPLLHIVWNGGLREIQLQLMGQVQIEVLKSLISDRFNLNVTFDEGHIMYRETIENAVEGVGHFEPLRHYAEVHLLLEPLEEGAGLVFAADCPEDELDRNWQRLILTHLTEKQHLGVLTGSPITDMKITLKSGRAHLKHTEGGDFRQSTYRAVRQGLMQAKSKLLEPWYSFRLEVQPEQLGRAINDIRAMSGEFETRDSSGELSLLVGMAPVSEMRGYAGEVVSYTRGKGRFSCHVAGYKTCHDQDKVVEELAYDPERDTDNSPDSVFCAHGAGFNVKWNEVPEYMHLPSILQKRSHSPVMRSFNIDEKELEAIMTREFGPVKRPQYTPAGNTKNSTVTIVQAKKRYIIVDGYNMIFAWDELKKLAADNLDLAREKLVEILSNYHGFTKNETVLVFDAYKVKGGSGSRSDRNGLHIVYTKEGETGDAYIERLVHDIGKNYAVSVVTSDNLIRLSALHSGVLRVSAKEFYTDISWVNKQIDEVLRRSNQSAHTKRMELEDKNGEG